MVVLILVGELCFTAKDCAAFQLSRRWAPDTNASISTNEESAWCAPEFCTLESSCGGAWTLDGAPADAPPGANSARPIINGSISCCGGFMPAAQCGVYGGSVDTCSSGYTCATAASAATPSRNTAQKPLADSSTTLLGRCASQEPHQQVWIGVLLVLIGGATLNVGLNLQKYAFRKRQQKAAADAAAAQAKHGRSPTPPSDVYFYSSGALHTTRKAVVAATLPPPPPQQPADNNDIAARNCDGDDIFEMTNCGDRNSTRRPFSALGTNTRRPSLSILPPPTLPATSATTPPNKTPFSSPVWLVGLVIFILGNVVNFIALQFAPQSLVAPLGAVSLVTNVIIAPLLNDEKISLFDVGGIVLIIAGCVVVVVFSGIVQQDYRLCVLIQLLKAKPTVLYLCLIFVLILAIYIFLWTVERGVTHYLQEHHQLGDSDTLTIVHTHDSLPNPGPPATWFQKTTRTLLQNPLLIFDRHVRPISPSSRHVQYGLPLAYASLGSLMATLTTLFAKSLVNLLSVSIFDHDNQFTSFITWGILLVTAFTAASQVYWINQGLQRYDALLQVPVFYVVWTVFDIIGGGVYFNEFKMFTTVKYVLFAVGVAIIFSGVGLLSNRLKRS
ncbi:hypothetical protein GGI19_003865 [Coemansia pectinata]|uniref:Magnesium transporter NIPA-domain-containing protein n=1 Tax=Coemansia pectinata TaxID=1052879 RepID=A0A9W8GX51_9FUNG|nr:hypothetical protein GGI19_003865 [Coemansia pectinata]